MLLSGERWCRADVPLSYVLAKERIINVLWFRRIYPDARDNSLGVGKKDASSPLV